MHAPQLVLTLFGGFRAQLSSGEAVSLPTRKAQGLIAYLALHPGQVHSREKLAAMLWSETGEEQARHSLRQTLVGLRKSLAPIPGLATSFDGEDLSLNPPAFTSDVLEFEKLIGEESAESLTAASRLYRGELLEGLNLREEPFEEWLLSERERFWELALQSLAKLLRHQMESNEPEAAIKTALRLLALDPLQEAVHRTLMKLYMMIGRREAALRQYQTCATVLQKELSIEPQRETRQLHADILNADRNFVPAINPDDSLSSIQRTRSVLVVEDDPVTRGVLEGILQGAGYNVVLAEDGADALYQLGKKPFDVLVSDIDMPNLSGLKLLEMMGQKNIDTPAIFLTGLTDEALEVQGLELGAVDFMRKPLKKDLLLIRVKNALARQRKSRVS